MASALRRNLLKLQANQNKQIAPMAKASAKNTQASPGTNSKSVAGRKGAGGTVKYAKQQPTGGDRSPLNPPAPQAQTARQRYSTPQPTGKKAPKGQSGFGGAVKKQKMP